MNYKTRKNMARYLCQRFYCHPEGQELTAILDCPKQINNLTALIEWLGQMPFDDNHTFDLEDWERKLKEKIDSKFM
ncbi:hypothetical protein [Parashewanella tropica]|uniref:hypothetical protein n=1 Tax=Parashewanella tropica TaxID=2547970 RepID=UPI001059D5BA|nr:hypothetical protein [Parashewanella tropica]